MLKLAFITLSVGLPLVLLPLAVLMVRTALWPSLYRGQEGQIAWIGHRLAGLGTLGFLALHIIDTSAVGFGPAAYDSLVSVYKTLWFRPFEALLAAAVAYHAVNGLKVTLWDFWPRTTDWHRPLNVIGLVLFIVLFAPMAWFMIILPYLEAFS